MDFQLGDIVKLKKPHPCGHMIMVPRKLVEKNCRGHKRADGTEVKGT